MSTPCLQQSGVPCSLLALEFEYSMRPHRESNWHAGGKASKFISEAQLEKNVAKHGERLEDGTFSGRTLTEAIIANREEKDAKFKDAWKQMKQGARAASTGQCASVQAFHVGACWTELVALPLEVTSRGRRPDSQQVFIQGRTGHLTRGSWSSSNS